MAARACLYAHTRLCQVSVLSMSVDIPLPCLQLCLFVCGGSSTVYVFSIPRYRRFSQLTPQRPLRPETDRRSRPMSGHFKASPLRVVPVPLVAKATTPRSMAKEDSHDYDDPPPLPMKHVSVVEVGSSDPEGRNSIAGHKASYYRERVSGAIRVHSDSQNVLEGT